MNKDKIVGAIKEYGDLREKIKLVELTEKGSDPSHRINQKTTNFRYEAQKKIEEVLAEARVGTRYAYLIYPEMGNVLHKSKEHYYVFLDREGDKWAWSVSVPGIPGISTFGEDLKDALFNATEAIECHVEGLAKDGLPAPTQPHCSQVSRSDGTLVVYVRVDIE